MRSFLLSYFRAGQIWLFQERHRQKAGELYQQAERLFTEHPHQAGESYFHHWWFTLRLSARVLLCGFYLLVHGFFPFLFTRAASTQMARIHAILERRVHALSDEE